jgi:2-keto-4-pentenoate hydratase
MDSNRVEAEMLFRLVEQLYGPGLTGAELEEVRKGVERIVEASAELRAVKLSNWDEPFSVFAPYRRRGK